MTATRVDLRPSAPSAASLLPLVEAERNLTSDGMATCLQRARPRTCNQQKDGPMDGEGRRALGATGRCWCAQSASVPRRDRPRAAQGASDLAGAGPMLTLMSSLPVVVRLFVVPLRLIHTRVHRGSRQEVTSRWHL